MKEKIREFIVTDILMDETQQIGDSENLLITGILDSLALMRLVMHLEDTHDIEIPPQDITLEHFATLDTMAAYLSRQLELQAA